MNHIRRRIFMIGLPFASETWKPHRVIDGCGVVRTVSHQMSRCDRLLPKCGQDSLGLNIIGRCCKGIEERQLWLVASDSGVFDLWSTRWRISLLSAGVYDGMGMEIAGA